MMVEEVNLITEEGEDSKPMIPLNNRSLRQTMENLNFAAE